MHPYALSIVADPAAAIAAHARDPRLAFIAGGTDLIGLMKDRAALPEHLLDINGLPDIAQIKALSEGGCIQPPPAMAAAYDKERVYESL